MHRGVQHASHSFQLGTNSDNVLSTWIWILPKLMSPRMQVIFIQGSH